MEANDPTQAAKMMIEGLHKMINFAREKSEQAVRNATPEQAANIKSVYENSGLNKHLKDFEEQIKPLNEMLKNI